MEKKAMKKATARGQRCRSPARGKRNPYEIIEMLRTNTGKTVCACVEDDAIEDWQPSIETASNMRLPIGHWRYRRTSSQSVMESRRSDRQPTGWRAATGRRKSSYLRDGARLIKARVLINVCKQKKKAIAVLAIQFLLKCTETFILGSLF